jgi:phosphatidylinositol-4,5-bisphosphate 3-kinase
MYSLLNRWQDIKPVVAIELLHSTYADIEVRNFAIRCLDKQMRDVEMQQYLIQLVQSLKNEPYYDNMLARFLLKRALKSQRIGFELFWNLKYEFFSFLIEFYLL